jgi:hypothetical protein
VGPLRQFAALGALCVAALAACGQAKPLAPPEGGASPTDAADTGEIAPVDVAVASDVFGANDVPVAIDLAGRRDAAEVGETRCVGADASTQDPFGGDCCQGLVVMQTTNASGAFVYTCSHCIEEGHPTLNTFGTDCCPGLRYIVSGLGPGRSCLGGIDPPGVCSRCGDGKCDDWELPCGCPEDCGVACGSSTCPVGSYCLQTTSGVAGGLPAGRCIDIAADCAAGVFSCDCASARSACGPGAFSCETQRQTAFCLL